MSAIATNIDGLANEISATYTAVDRKDRDAHAAARAVYNAANADLRKQFAADLADQYAYGLTTAQTDRIFEKAWEDGHASGYHEVESHYQDLVSFVEDILKG